MYSISFFNGGRERKAPPKSLAGSSLTKLITGVTDRVTINRARADFCKAAFRQRTASYGTSEAVPDAPRGIADVSFMVRSVDLRKTVENGDG
jgi:hypothetical protein